MKKITFLLSIVMLFMIVSSCTKDDAKLSYPVKVHLTDAPGPYNAVYIDLLGVELTGNDGVNVMMDVNSGIYNLLDFTNGVDTLIATGALEVSTIQQIRLVLGTNNSVMIDSVIYPLSTPSAQQSGLKLQVHQKLEAGVVYSILLDFDANKSIVDHGNGTYSLKPIIRTVVAALSGSIKGNITPIGTLAFVTATADTTYSSDVDSTGKFIVMGLPEGTYSLTVTPELPLIEVTQNDIIVTTGVTTNIGTIDLE